MKDFMYNIKQSRLNIYLIYKEEKIWKDKDYSATLSGVAEMGSIKFFWCCCSSP